MKVEKRINEIVNRLNKTKVERKPDLKGKGFSRYVCFGDIYGSLLLKAAFLLHSAICLLASDFMFPKL